MFDDKLLTAFTQDEIDEGFGFGFWFAIAEEKERSAHGIKVIGDVFVSRQNGAAVFSFDSESENPFSIGP